MGRRGRVTPPAGQDHGLGGISSLRLVRSVVARISGWCLGAGWDRRHALF